MFHSGSQAPSRILVGDDEPEIVAFIRELLISRNYKLLGFSDSREASTHFDSLTSLNDVHSATLEALSMALDFRDQSTSGHSRRVADLTAGAAQNMGIRDSALVQIEHGALLHDIGKLKSRTAFSGNRQSSTTRNGEPCGAMPNMDMNFSEMWSS